MKIGIDARLWNQTGVGRYVRNLVHNLELIDKENDYILFARSEDMGEFKIQNSKFKIVQTDVRWHSIEEQLKLPGILRKYNLDIVHFPYYSVPVFFNKPFVVTIHDLIPLHFQTGKASTLPFPFYKLKFLAYKYVVQNAAKKAKKIIAPSNFSKKDIVDYLGTNPAKINVVYEGVDSSLVEDVKLENKGNNFLYIGNAYPHKNLEFLLDVFKDLPKDFKLTLVGREDYFYKRLKKRASQLNLQRKVIFAGFVNDSSLSLLYKKSKALIIPSFIEGFGLPALEAMANKCLVLASDTPTLREICKDAAVYFDLKNKDDLKNKIIEISGDSDKIKNYIDKGVKRASQFSWKKTAEETLKIYESSYSLRSDK